MNNIFFLCLGVVILTWSLSHLYRLIATAVQIMDHANHRSAHEGSTPTGAGVAFVITFLIGLYLIESYGQWQELDQMLFDILPGVLLVTVIGFIDDVRPLHWLLRAPLHVLGATWVIFQTSFPDLNLLGHQVETSIITLGFGVVALVWLLNLYNFMDGIDGLAASEALFVLMGSVAAGWSHADAEAGHSLLVLASACFGFLVINWPKARVFMGDGGSNFLGLMLGALALSEFLVPVWSWVILLGWFITDACLTICLRLYRGEKIHEAHSQHAYQHLNRAFGTVKTLIMVQAFNLFWLLPLACLAARMPEIGIALLSLAYAPLLVLQFLFGAGQLKPRLKAISSN